MFAAPIAFDALLVDFYSSRWSLKTCPIFDPFLWLGSVSGGGGCASAVMQQAGRGMTKTMRNISVVFKNNRSEFVGSSCATSLVELAAPFGFAHFVRMIDLATPLLRRLMRDKHTTVNRHVRPASRSSRKKRRNRMRYRIKGRFCGHIFRACVMRTNSDGVTHAYEYP